MPVDVYPFPIVKLGDMCLKKAALIAAQRFSQILFSLGSHDLQWGLQDQNTI